MKSTTTLAYAIWNLITLICLIIMYFEGKITAGSYYLGLIGCGIWLTLINIYHNKE